MIKKAVFFLLLLIFLLELFLVPLSIMRSSNDKTEKAEVTEKVIEKRSEKTAESMVEKAETPTDIVMQSPEKLAEAVEETTVSSVVAEEPVVETTALEEFITGQADIAASEVTASEEIIQQPVEEKDPEVASLKEIIRAIAFGRTGTDLASPEQQTSLDSATVEEPMRIDVIDAVEETKVSAVVAEEPVVEATSSEEIIKEHANEKVTEVVSLKDILREMMVLAMRRSVETVETEASEDAIEEEAEPAIEMAELYTEIASEMQEDMEMQPPEESAEVTDDSIEECSEETAELMAETFGTPTDIVMQSPEEPAEVVLTVETTETDVPEAVEEKEVPDFQMEVPEPMEEVIQEPMEEAIPEPEPEPMEEVIPEPEPAAPPVDEQMEAETQEAVQILEAPAPIMEEKAPAALDHSRERKVELSANWLLSSGQHIVYNYGLLLEEQLSLYGMGMQLGVYYNIHERFAVGTHVGYEVFLYTDLMDYRDLKFDGSARIRINSIGNDRFGLFVSCFVGTDFVIREDRAKAIYYMHGYGASLDFRMGEGMYFNAGCNMAVTFQDGSAVSHLAGYIGLSWVRE